MKHRPVPTLVLSAIAVLLVVAGSTAAWAACPASPNYTVDFSSELSQPCLTLNSNAILFSNSSTVLRLTNASANQVGSAWFNTPQPVQNQFSTTFQFQFTNPSTPPADGIAFVIQNTSLSAIGFTGGSGGALGYGDDDGSTNPSTGAGIPNSLAIEFDTFHNDPWDPPADVSGNASHVAVQSCGTGRNTSHHGYLCGGDSGSQSTLGAPVSTANLADGAIHKVTITYTPPSPSGCDGPCSGSLHVILDNTDLYPSGVPVDLGSLLSLNEGGTAFVGFTGATGADVEIQDIRNWTFTPQAQSAPITVGGGTAILAFQGGVANNAYDYNAALQAVTGGVTSATVQVKPILIDEEACEKLVQKSFPFTTQCFVYKNAADSGTDSAVMFELTCPDQPGGTCGSQATQNFFAELGTNFTFTKAENPGFKFPGTFGILNPFPGWLKGAGPDPLHPCTPNPNNSPALFQSNQIDFFSVVGDPTGTTKGKSGGGGSCWVATYFTWGELPPGIKISSPAFTTYTQNQSVTASYTCSNPITSKPAGNAKGPYLTVASCTQSQAPKPNSSFNTNTCSGSGATTGKLACTGPVDTSILGLHVFQVTALDSGGNANVSVVVYNVKKH